MKKKLLYLSLLALLGSCTKADHNGLLGGNWRLSEHVFFSLYTDMVQWRHLQSAHTYMGHFRHSGDSLVLTLSDGQTRGIYCNDGSHDVAVTNAADLPVEFCIPANFGYRIVRVSGSELVLQAGAQTLTFKRY